MARRILVLLALASTLLATMATTAAARSEQRSDIPACEELLTTQDAGSALREPYAFVLRREVVGTTRNCDYTGGKGHALPARTLGVTWGPWAELRNRSVSFAKKNLCPVSKQACGEMAKLKSVKRDLDSFKHLEQALAETGTARRLRSLIFEGNPVVAWRPSEATGLSDFAWVFVYDVNTTYLLETFCIDNAVSTPDAACAIAAAELVYENVKS